MSSEDDEPAQASSYRVKFERKEFMRLVEIAQPKVIFQTDRIHFFAYKGFVVYTFECTNKDFPNQIIFYAIEFSNVPWATR